MVSAQYTTRIIGSTPLICYRVAKIQCGKGGEVLLEGFNIDQLAGFSMKYIFVLR